MKRISFGTVTPKSFEEYIDFDYEAPHSVRIKRFLTEDIVPLHYGETLEMLLCENLTGEMTIENKRYPLGGNQVFIIPPNTVHSNFIRKCDGRMFVIKTAFEHLANFINLVNIMEYNHCYLSQLPFTCPEYEKLLFIVQRLIDEDENIYSRMQCILAIFEILQRYAYRHPAADLAKQNIKSTQLRELIRWTIANYNQKITLDEAARKMGYSKYYFCNMFKSMTGTTYLTYLNHVRISQACRELKQGQSIAEACFKCGFENVSYFIQLFKKICGCTPGEYADGLNQKRPGYGSLV
jgi:AraC-like DNA-binding protein